MFLSHPKLLLLFKRRSLEIYYQGSEKVMKFEFPSDVLRHLEIVKKDEFSKIIVEAIKETNLNKQKAILALSDHVTFEKIIPVDPQTEGLNTKEIQKFFHNIPLDEDKIAKKIIPLKNQLLLLAANREVFQTIIDLSSEFDWNILTVVPAHLFADFDNTLELNPEQVTQILKAPGITDNETNFLKEDVIAEEDDTITTKKTSKSLSFFLIFLFLALLIGGSIFFAVFFKFLKIPDNLFNFSQKAVTLSPSPTPTPSEGAQAESTDSAQIASESAELKKEEIKIHVLNGSGIAGQANVVKEKLVEAGFTDVVSGNIESSEASSSSITYSQKITLNLKQELNTLMDSLVEGITKLDDFINEFDVVITLGKLDKPIE